MSGKQPTDIDRQIAAATELRELTRDAHAAIGGSAPDQGRQRRGRRRGRRGGHRHRRQLRIQLGGLEERVAAAITEATGKVLAGFDAYGEALVGRETYWAKVTRGAPPNHPPASSRPGLDGAR